MKYKNLLEQAIARMEVKMSDNRERGFEIVSSFVNMNIHIPERKTLDSAGYDIEAAEDTVVPVFSLGQQPVLVKTGLKAYFKKDEFLMLVNRSSGPFKLGLVMANSVGIIDSDYYNNPDNEGHFMFAFYNFSKNDVLIKKGERIGQAIFCRFSTTDNDHTTNQRLGGFGST